MTTVNNRQLTKSRTANLSLCALFTALTGICACIAVPLPFTPVPVSLATLAVLLSGGLLGAKYGAISQIVYIVLGAIGIPIYHSFTSGVGILVGPTGGYLVGYIAMAFVIGLLIKRLPLNKYKGYSVISIGIAITIGMYVCYALGTLWFMLTTGTGLWSALAMCVLPFLPGDALKLIAGTILIKKLRPILLR